jgi:hypothetical protein
MGASDGYTSYDPSQLELFERALAADDPRVRTIRLSDGQLVRGNWVEIVRQMRDHAGFAHESITHYMRRLAERWHEQSGDEIPFTDPETFLRAAADAGLLRLEEE